MLDSKLVRLRYAWYYRIKSPSGPSSALAVLWMPQPSFGTLNAVEPRLTYPNLYVVYRKGAANGNADGLSRQAWNEDGNDDATEDGSRLTGGRCGGGNRTKEEEGLTPSKLIN